MSTRDDLPNLFPTGGRESSAAIWMSWTRGLAISWWLLTVLSVAGVAVFLTSIAIWLDGPLLPAVAACLLCPLVIATSVQPVRELVSARAYPIRYWKVATGCMVYGILMNLIFGGTALTLIFRAAYRDASPLGAAAAIVMFMFWLFIGTIGFGASFYRSGVSVTPFFQSKVGEIDVFDNGRCLARHLLDLDALARTAGVTPLSDFGWGDASGVWPIAWHSPATGLKTVNTLLALLECDDFDGDEQAGVVEDLKRIAHALGRADAQSIRFCLVLIIGPACFWRSEEPGRVGTFY